MGLVVEQKEKINIKCNCYLIRINNERKSKQVFETRPVEQKGGEDQERNQRQKNITENTKKWHRLENNAENR